MSAVFVTREYAREKKSKTSVKLRTQTRSSSSSRPPPKKSERASILYKKKGDRIDVTGGTQLGQLTAPSSKRENKKQNARIDLSASQYSYMYGLAHVHRRRRHLERLCVCIKRERVLVWVWNKSDGIKESNCSFLKLFSSEKTHASSKLRKVL